MATFTASEINPLKAVHVGENFVRSRFTGSLTVSEVLLLARVPNGAVITDWMISGGMTGQTTGTWKIGFQGTVVDAISGATLTDDSLHAGVSLTSSGIGGWLIRQTGFTVTVSATGNIAANLPSLRNIYPVKISLSDDAVPQFVWLQGLFTVGSQTGTHSINFLVKYYVGEKS